MELPRSQYPDSRLGPVDGAKIRTTATINMGRWRQSAEYWVRENSCGCGESSGTKPCVCCRDVSNNNISTLPRDALQPAAGLRDLLSLAARTAAARLLQINEARRRSNARHANVRSPCTARPLAVSHSRSQDYFAMQT
ncbi:hypothetical protein ACJJTC_009945 [Scirpophaga incertulas]